MKTIGSEVASRGEFRNMGYMGFRGSMVGGYMRYAGWLMSGLSLHQGRLRSDENNPKPAHPILPGLSRTFSGG